MEIRKLKPFEKETAMDLVWRVFLKFEAPEYTPEGVRTFYTFITDRTAVEDLTVYGALEGGSIIGVLAVQAQGGHISLFFVDPAWHRKGVGKALFHRFLKDSSTGQISVNSSPYAVEVYHHLGFQDTAPEQEQDGIRYTPMCYRRQIARQRG